MYICTTGRSGKRTLCDKYGFFCGQQHNSFIIHEQLKKCVGCEFHNWIVNIFDVVRYKNINTIDRPK